MKAETKTTVCFAVAAVLLLATAAGTWINARQLLFSERLAAHSQGTLGKLGDLLRSIQEAQVGVQGFFLTGEETYLVPYEVGLEEIGASVEELRQWTAEDPEQRRNIDALKQQANRLVAYLHRGVEARRGGGMPALLRLLGTEGKERMDQIRFAAATVRRAELGLLDHRSDDVRRAGRLAKIYSITLLGVCAFVLAAAWREVRRQVLRRRQTDDALRTSEDKFHGLLEVASDAVIVTDSEGSIRLVNARAAEIFGYHSDELTGVPIGTLLQTLPADVASDGAFPGSTGQTKPLGKRKDQSLFAVDSTEKLIEGVRERVVIHAFRLAAAAEPGEVKFPRNRSPGRESRATG